MNVHYLMQYISRQLHTMVRRYDTEGFLKETVCQRQDLSDLPGTADELLPYFTGEIPLFLNSSRAVTYAAVRGDGDIFLLGPVRLGEYEYLTHHMSDREYPAGWVEGLYSCSLQEMTDTVLLLHNLFHEEELTEIEIMDRNCLKEGIWDEIEKEFSDSIFDNQENLIHHNPYDQEVREVNSIRNGDLQQLKKSWAEDYTGKIGTLSRDPLRHSRNLAIVLITLASRAAMDGGLLPELAYTLSDTYIQKVEEVRTPEAAERLGREAEYHYAELVRDEKDRQASREKIQDPRILRAKEYIFAHLHEKISTSDVAEALYVSENYLSTLFKKEEGVTIGSYILNEKIRLAKNMLIYSSYSYSDIAQYLGFSSQSHLGDRFRRATGMTLQQYRNKYGVNEFKE